MTVKVYHTETLTLSDSNENADLTSEDTMSGSEVKMGAQEGGKITLEIDIEILYVESSSGAEVTLTGKGKKKKNGDMG